jgi:uncharacterized membrane protein YfcA
MNTAKLILLVALIVAGIVQLLRWVVTARRYAGRSAPHWLDALAGLVTCFLDAIGIGNFAQLTAYLKIFKRCPDEQIPGTLIVGTGLLAVVESVVYIRAVEVNPILLVTTVGAAALGAWFGAGVVARLPRRAIQGFMGAALLIAGIVFCAINLNFLPGGGDALDLNGWRFALAVGVNLVLGALMSAGIGMYAPCMIMLALLGMNPKTAFPIMMGSCGLLQPVASLRFLASQRYAFGPALAITLAGTIGVLIAVVFVTQELSLYWLRWLVVVVVGYGAISMLRSAHANRQA